MPFKSEKQRKWMHANEPKMAKDWEKKKKSETWGHTEEIPVDEAKKRDYKAEYKKFQSSTKSKKYRAELNQYNRKKGTYGNGDGKDASHKRGKIVGFESQSKNRGRAEKSRLKKESINEQEMSIKDAFKDLVKKHGAKKALKILTSVLVPMGFEDPKNKKKFQQQLLKKMTKESTLESINEGNPLELGKLRDAILMFKKKIEKQGMVKNARDEDHLERLIKVYNKMGGKKIKEGFGGELKGKQKKKFEKARVENAEQLGYKVTGVKDVKEGTTTQFPSVKVDAAVKLAKRMGGNMTGAVKRIEKMAKGLSKNGRVQYALRKANEGLGDKMAKKIKKHKGTKVKKEGVNEAKEPPVIVDLRDIVKKKQNKVMKDPVSGKKMRVDGYTANAIVKVYDAINTSNKKKFTSQPLMKMAKIAFKFVK